MKNFYARVFLVPFALLFFQNSLFGQCSFTTGVPYYENFNGINTSSPVPVCWALSNTVTCLTQPSGGTAAFYYSPANTGYFYTNGIQLYSGVTYSVALAYKTDYYGYTNWTDLSILVGPNQSTTGLTQVASTGGIASSPVFTQLSNTFVVASPGIYYLAIKGTSNGNCCGYYLTWDDLSVTAPCNVNPVNLVTASSANTICLGQSATYTVSGAHTYSWSNGAITPIATFTPGVSGNLWVKGTNTITGCSTTVTSYVTVKPTPQIYVYCGNPNICSGTPANLVATGADFYMWSDGSNGSYATVTPTANTIYTVTGVNNAGCSATGTILITVNPNPTVSIATSQTVLCEAETVTLTASGASTYSWSSPFGNVIGHTVAVSMTANITYVVIGENQSACTDDESITLNISDCTGLNDHYDGSNNVAVYPNPASDRLEIKTSGELKQLRVSGVDGREIMRVQSPLRREMEISRLSPGVYFLHVATANSRQVIKFIKE